MLLYLYIYYCCCSPTASSPPDVTHIRVSAFFFSEPPYFPGTAMVPNTGCWPQNSFGVTILMLLELRDFPEKNSKCKKVRIAPVGARYWTSPIYNNNGHTLQKQWFFIFFFYRTTFVTRLRRYCLFCPGAPKGRICDFHDLYQLFSKFLLFPRT